MTIWKVTIYKDKKYQPLSIMYEADTFQELLEIIKNEPVIGVELLGWCKGKSNA